MKLPKIDIIIVSDIVTKTIMSIRPNIKTRLNKEVLNFKNSLPYKSKYKLDCGKH